ncbi:hypothetical protein G9A89_008110 [Geosiphon pyriformis]|nr:hypothetical protein G9A89_008110 [Geosiphon pyriformis]
MPKGGKPEEVLCKLHYREYWEKHYFNWTLEEMRHHHTEERSQRGRHLSSMLMSRAEEPLCSPQITNNQKILTAHSNLFTYEALGLILLLIKEAEYYLGLNCNYQTRKDIFKLFTISWPNELQPQGAQNENCRRQSPGFCGFLDRSIPNMKILTKTIVDTCSRLKNLIVFLKIDLLNEETSKLVIPKTSKEGFLFIMVANIFSLYQFQPIVEKSFFIQSNCILILPLSSGILCDSLVGSLEICTYFQHFFRFEDAMESTETVKESTVAAIRRKVSISSSMKGTLTSDDGLGIKSTRSNTTTASNPTITTTTTTTNNSSGRTKLDRIFSRRPSVSGSSSTTKNFLSDMKLTRADSTPTKRSTPQIPSEMTSYSHQQPRTAGAKLRKPTRPPSGQYSSPTLGTTEEEPSTESNDQTVGDHNNNHSIARKLTLPVGTSTNNSNRKTNNLFSLDIGNKNDKELANKVNALKDDRMEKLSKKAKIFFDPRSKPKARAASLWGFIDAANELDQAQFFQDNADEVFDVTYKAYISQVDKIKDKSDRINNVEQAVKNHENYGLSELGQDLIRSDDRGPLYQNPYPPTYNDAVTLLKIALSGIARLAHVAAGSILPPENYDFAMMDNNIQPDNGIAIGIGIDAALEAAKFQYDLLKKYYLVKLFPACSKEKVTGFDCCPPTVLRALIQFFIDYCLDNNFGSSEHVTSFPSPATPILKSIVLAPENREFAHEIIRQALLLPAGISSTKDIVRGAVHIVGVWILSGEEERPAFLRKTISLSPLPVTNNSSLVGNCQTIETSSSTLSCAASYADANIYLRRYIKLLTYVFNDHSMASLDIGITNLEVEAQISIYRDVLSLYRSIMAEGPIELETETWETLLAFLLEIQQKTINQKEKYGPFPSTYPANEFADYLIETILIAYVRSMSTQSDLWQGLVNQMRESTRWSQTIFQWKKVMDRLTKILSKHLYKVDLEAVDLNRRLSELSSSERHRRRPSNNRTRHLSLKGSRHKSTGSNSSREEVASQDQQIQKNSTDHKSSRRVTSIHQDDSKLLGGPTLLHFVSNGFNGGSSNHSGSIASENEEDEDQEEDEQLFGASSDMSMEEHTGNKSNRTSTSSAFFALANFSSDRISLSLGTFKSLEFTNIDGLPWNAESSLTIWKKMLCALGNVNKIQIPPNHAEAIKGLINIWDTLTLTRKSQPYSDFPLPLLHEFAPWFFEACDLPITFGSGRSFAYGAICKIMSRKQEQDIPGAYYAHFYRILLKGLSDSDNSITHAIINNSARLFSQNLPGYSILFYTFIESITNLLTKQNRSHVPEATRQNAITILCSLICVVNQITSGEIPVITYYQLGNLNTVDYEDFSDYLINRLPCSEVRFNIMETLIKSLATEESIHNSDTHIMLLQGICTLAFDEITSTSSPSKNVIKQCFDALFDQLYWSHLPVVCAAADCLIVFAQNCSITWDDDGLYLMMVQDVFGNLIGALNHHLNLQKGAQRNGRGFILAKLFYCLLEWLMVLPPKLFTDTELYQLVFEAIDLAFDVTGTESPKHHDKLLPIPPNKSRGKRHGNDATVRFKKAERTICLSANLNNEHGVHVVGADSIEDADLVKDVAECVLLHLTHHLNNFAPLHGPAMISSNLMGPIGSETKDEEISYHYQYFSFNDTTIITLVEMPGEETSVSRMIVRDVTGRYAWDSKLFYKAHRDNSLNNGIEERRYVGMTDQLVIRPDIKITKLPEIKKGESRSLMLNKFESSPKITNTPISTDPLPLPVWTVENQANDENMLQRLLEFVGEQHPDCRFYPSGSNLSAVDEDPVLSVIDVQLERHIQEEACYRSAMDPHAKSWYESVILIRNRILNMHDHNKSIAKISKVPLYSRSTSHLSLGADFSLCRSFLPVLPPEAEKPTEPYQHCRLFLGHFGWLSPETLKDNAIYLLNKTPALYRDIRLLDKKHPREVVKIALLYVAPGQEDEQSILHNINGSSMYDEFVASLGWEIDLATHPGYIGGLERNSTNGSTATYFCTSTIEIIYHDVTKMPTDPTDPKQLKKKRHIGNDHVHIIWNENYREYQRNTIGGDFGNVQIVITPLPNEMFSIDLSRDQKIPLFGPLLNGMVVSRNVLGTLVRMTAVQAFRNCLHHINTTNNTMYQHPYMERVVDITKITGRHKNNKSTTYETFMSRIFVSDEE